MKKNLPQQGGFTLVEITLAMAIFTFMLLIVSMAYINIARLYSASTAARNVQQNNRFAMEQMSRVARSANEAVVSQIGANNGTASWLCFGSRAGSQIFYLENVGDVYKNRLHQATISSCPASSDAVPAVTNDQVISSENAYVARLVADTSTPQLVGITLTMVSKTDLLDTSAPTTLQCKRGAGSEFCAVNNLTTTVELRGN